MKKLTAIILVLSLFATTFILTGCGQKDEDPGAPPQEIIQGDDNSKADDSIYDGEILENAVTVNIGRNGMTDWTIDMYNIDASNTMLGYLSGSPLLFPTYTYDEETGYVAQNVRGRYTRDDEVTVENVKAGELYLFGDGQLRFYFKDVEGANITATPVGYYNQTEGLAEAVQDAYKANLGDVWGVDVYFVITKNID